jgi:hypothetical protein
MWRLVVLLFDSISKLMFLLVVLLIKFAFMVGALMVKFLPGCVSPKQYFDNHC